MKKVPEDGVHKFLERRHVDQSIWLDQIFIVAGRGHKIHHLFEYE